MASKVNIMDRAAGLVGAERITDPDSIPNNARARRIVGLYPMVLDEALTVWPWVCVRDRALLTAMEQKPAWGFAYQYSLPGDALGVQAANTGGCAWEVEGRKLLTDYAGPVQALVSIRQKEEWLHPLVASFAATRLAMASVMGVATSTTAQERLKGLVQDAFIEASHAENAQGSSLDKLSSGWVLAMQTGYAPELRGSGAIPPDEYWLGKEQEIPG